MVSSHPTMAAIPENAMPQPTAAAGSEPGPELVEIPAGWFLMGSNAGQDVEVPVHRIWVDRFQLAAAQVTVEEYGQYLDATGKAPPPFRGEPHFRHPQQPVVAVSWFEAAAYCEWRTAQTGTRYRLPTEAEWERAARGGAEGRLFPWGDDPPSSRSGYGRRWLEGPEPVRQSEPNGYGLFEMCENVHEWCGELVRCGLLRLLSGAECRVRRRACEGRRAAGRGATRSKLRAARRAPASLRNSSMRITAFAWPAIKSIFAFLGDG